METSIHHSGGHVEAGHARVWLGPPEQVLEPVYPGIRDKGVKSGLIMWCMKSDGDSGVVGKFFGPACTESPPGWQLRAEPLQRLYGKSELEWHTALSRAR